MSVCWKDISFCRDDFCEVAEVFPSILMPVPLVIGVRDRSRLLCLNLVSAVFWGYQLYVARDSLLCNTLIWTVLRGCSYLWYLFVLLRKLLISTVIPDLVNSRLQLRIP